MWSADPGEVRLTPNSRVGHYKGKKQGGSHEQSTRLPSSGMGTRPNSLANSLWTSSHIIRTQHYSSCGLCRRHVCHMVEEAAKCGRADHNPRRPPFSSLSSLSPTPIKFRI